jgi:ribonuclease HI
VPGILLLQSPHNVQVQHDQAREDFICSGHGFAQATTLLRGVQSTGHFGQGLGELFRNPEASARIAKWAAELSRYNFIFEPRTTIKSQVLADFIVD